METSVVKAGGGMLDSTARVTYVKARFHQGSALTLVLPRFSRALKELASIKVGSIYTTQHSI